MANKTSKKPGALNQNKSDAALMMKRKDNNILHSHFTKIIFLLMILAFVGIPVVQLIMMFVNYFFKG